MEEEIFCNWFSDFFVPHVEEIRLKYNLLGKKALLLFDGHKSHVNVHLILLA